MANGPQCLHKELPLNIGQEQSLLRTRQFFTIFNLQQKPIFARLLFYDTTILSLMEQAH